VMVFDAEFYKALIGNLNKVFKSGAQVFLYEIGVAYGELLAKRLADAGGLSRSTARRYAEEYSTLAVGKFEFPPLETLAGKVPGTLTIGLRESFFATSLGRTGQAECHIVRGILEGTAKTMFGQDYACSEEKCMSKGDQRCEFLLSRRKG
ncbi:MAG: V4R domain-containing protein, partial [Nitrososphaerales archaeon]